MTSKPKFTAKGTFLYTQYKNQLNFYLDKDTPDFQITVKGENPIITVSECENFVIAIDSRKHNMDLEYKVYLYSLFEEHLIYETDWLVGARSLPASKQFHLNSSGTYFYQFEQGNTLVLYQISMENDFFQIKRQCEHLMQNVKAIEWSPLQNYLAVFQKARPDLPSQFTIIDPSISEAHRQKVVSRTFYVEQIRLVWQSNGKQVSVITDTKQSTQIINYLMTTNFPCTSTKFPPGSTIVDFEYSFDSKYCVSLVQMRNVEKKGKKDQNALQDQKSALESKSPSVYIQKVNCDDKPTKIISLDAEKLYFCP